MINFSAGVMGQFNNSSGVDVGGEAGSDLDLDIELDLEMKRDVRQGGPPPHIRPRSAGSGEVHRGSGGMVMVTDMRGSRLAV